MFTKLPVTVEYGDRAHELLKRNRLQNVTGNVQIECVKAVALIIGSGHHEDTDRA